MKVVGRDEREYLWEGEDPTFLVILYDGGGPPDVLATSWSTDTLELSECGLLDAIRWAQDHVRPGGAWAVGLVEVRPDPATGATERGFTYLEGYDANSGRDGLTDWEGRQLDEMLTRLDRELVLPATSTTVFPNGSAATPSTGRFVTYYREE